MSHSPRRIASALTACTLLVAACTASNDTSDDGLNGAAGTTVASDGPATTDDSATQATAADGSIHAMLGLVADSDEHADLVLVSLYGRADDAVHLDLEGEPGDEAYEMNRLLALTTNGDTGLILHTPELAGGARTPEVLGRMGFFPSDLTAEIQVGQRPFMTTIAVGDLDADIVLDRAAATEGADRTEIGGTEVVAWLDDNDVDVNLDVPVGKVRGEAGRLAIPTDRVLVHTTTDAAMADAIAAISGARPSLADRPGLGPAATALDDAGVVAAYLSETPITLSGQRLTPEQQTQMAGSELAPYLAYGVGGALDGDAPTVVIVLTHDNNDAAETNAERLAANVADGHDLVTGQRWNTILTEPRIDQHENVVVARFSVGSPRMWQQLVLTRASVLATA